MASYTKRYSEKFKSGYDDDYEYDDDNYGTGDELESWQLPENFGRVKSKKQAHKFHRR